MNIALDIMLPDNGNLIFAYRSNGKWNNSVLFHVAVSALIWLPLVFFYMGVAIEADSLRAYLGYPSILFLIALYLFRRAQLKIKFPEVEVSAQHLIFNRPIWNRSVYNLNEIKNPRFVFNVLYFRHLGWPILESFPSMPKEKQDELIDVLIGG